MAARQLPKATEEEVQRRERDYWRQKFHSILTDWRLYLLLFPLAFFFVVWKYIPIGTRIRALKDYKIDSSFGGGAFTSDFIGFYSFQFLFQQTKFWSAFRNTFLLSFYGLVFGFPFPIILALFFSEIRNKAYRSVAQVFCYLPKFISLVVRTTIISRLLAPSSQVSSAGPIEAIFEHRGVHDLLTNAKAFRSVFTVSGIWQEAGYGSIVYFAAILGISPTNYEAARIDGATKRQQIRYVTIPGRTATLAIMLILKIGSLLTVGYEKVYLLQQLGAPFETSETVSTYVINTFMGNSNANQGMGAAADRFNSLLSRVLVIGANKVSKRVSSASLY